MLSVSTSSKTYEYTKLQVIISIFILKEVVLITIGLHALNAALLELFPTFSQQVAAFIPQEINFIEPNNNIDQNHNFCHKVVLIKALMQFETRWILLHTQTSASSYMKQEKPSEEAFKD